MAERLLSSLGQAIVDFENRVQSELDNWVGTHFWIRLSCNTKAVQLNIVGTKNETLRDVSSVRALGPEEVANLYREKNNSDGFARTFINMMASGLRAENTRDRHKIRWMNYLMRLIESKTVRNTIYRTLILHRAYIASAFEDVYRRLFVIYVKLIEKDERVLGHSRKILVNATATARIVDVNQMMYCVAGSVILIMVVVLVFHYWHRQQTVGYPPATLAGLDALLYASNAKEECGEYYGRDPAERAKNLQDLCVWRVSITGCTGRENWRIRRKKRNRRC